MILLGDGLIYMNNGRKYAAGARLKSVHAKTIRTVGVQILDRGVGEVARSCSESLGDYSVETNRPSLTRQQPTSPHMHSVARKTRKNAKPPPRKRVKRASR